MLTTQGSNFVADVLALCVRVGDKILDSAAASLAMVSGSQYKGLGERGGGGGGAKVDDDLRRRAKLLLSVWNYPVPASRKHRAEIPLTLTLSLFPF